MSVDMCVLWWYVPVRGQVMEWVSPSAFTQVPRTDLGCQTWVVSTVTC